MFKLKKMLPVVLAICIMFTMSTTAFASRLTDPDGIVVTYSNSNNGVKVNFEERIVLGTKDGKYYIKSVGYCVIPTFTFKPEIVNADVTHYTHELIDDNRTLSCTASVLAERDYDSHAYFKVNPDTGYISTSRKHNNDIQ